MAKRISRIRQQYSKGFKEELSKIIVPVAPKVLDHTFQPLIEITTAKGA